MGLVVRGLIKRGGVWWVRVVVPADVRSVIGKTELLATLSTGDNIEAVRLGTPVIAQFKRQIADARGEVYAPPPADDRLTAALAQSRIATWKQVRIHEAEADSFNAAPVGSLWRDAGAVERATLIHALSQPDAAGRVEGFKDRLAEALGVRVDHPALEHIRVQSWFREAWETVERAKERFARGDFDIEEVVDEVAYEAPQDAPGGAVKANAGSKSAIGLEGLLDAFLRHENPPEARDIKRAWRLFT
ncbi:MAG TPA: DUF6538 domain-containing protein [Caulobacteraceae bacterium]|jgi:hypothetical protein